jgi:hypothetical protein
MKTLDSFDQAFAAYVLCRGGTIASVRREPSGFVLYSLDDSAGHASKCLGEWRENQVLVSAKRYASSMRAVIRITTSARQQASHTTMAQEGVHINDYARTAAR